MGSGGSRAPSAAAVDRDPRCMWCPFLRGWHAKPSLGTLRRSQDGDDDIKPEPANATTDDTIIAGGLTPVVAFGFGPGGVVECRLTPCRLAGRPAPPHRSRMCAHR